MCAGCRTLSSSTSNQLTPLVACVLMQTLTDRMIESIPQHLRQNILKALRALVIAFDNMSPGEKARLTTASEIVKNKDWLIKVRHNLASLQLFVRSLVLGDCMCFRQIGRMCMLAEHESLRPAAKARTGRAEAKPSPSRTSLAPKAKMEEKRRSARLS